MQLGFISRSQAEYENLKGKTSYRLTHCSEHIKGVWEDNIMLFHILMFNKWKEHIWRHLCKVSIKENIQALRPTLAPDWELP